MSPERPTRPRKTNEQLCEDIEEVKAMIGEVTRTVRGYNGIAGLAGRFEAFEAKMLVELRSINEKLILLSNEGEQRGKLQAAAAADVANVKWPTLFDKLFAPVVVAIIVAVLSHVFK